MAEFKNGKRSQSIVKYTLKPRCLLQWWGKYSYIITFLYHHKGRNIFPCQSEAVGVSPVLAFMNIIFLLSRIIHTKKFSSHLTNKSQTKKTPKTNKKNIPPQVKPWPQKTSPINNHPKPFPFEAPPAKVKDPNSPVGGGRCRSNPLNPSAKHQETLER